MIFFFSSQIDSKPNSSSNRQINHLFVHCISSVVILNVVYPLHYCAMVNIIVMTKPMKPIVRRFLQSIIIDVKIHPQFHVNRIFFVVHFIWIIKFIMLTFILFKSVSNGRLASREGRRRKTTRQGFGLMLIDALEHIDLHEV